MTSTNFTQRPDDFFTDASALVTSRDGVASLAVVIGLCYLASFFFQKSSNLPYINYDKSQWTYSQGKVQFRSQAKKLIAQGFEKFSGPFNLITDVGPLIMLPPEYIDAVNHEQNLSFQQFVSEDKLAQYNTFKNFHPGLTGYVVEAVLKGLTRSLPKFTKPLSKEMELSLRDTWAESTEWHEIDLREDTLTWVARLSSRIFSGDRLTHSSEWLRISKEFTVSVFTAVRVVKTFPLPLRWIAERTLPICRTVRADRRACAALLAPILAEREAEIAAAKREGRAPVLPDDSIEWLRNAVKGQKVDEALLQLNLSMAAIHTTSDLIGQALLNLGAHPEMVEPLRDEAIEVLKTHGWTKVALTELRIMDSFLKETQRLKPIVMSCMHRTATADINLNGLKIHKGQKLGISSHRMWSEVDYEDPETFDGFRFAKRRKVPGFEHKSHLISTSHEHLAFAHGRHACPGRFFAANEVKIAMVHLLLKYDVRLDDPSWAIWKEWGTSMNMNPKARMSVRRRKEEIDLDSM